MNTVEQSPPPFGDKRNDTHYWPTAKAYEAVGEVAPDFIRHRDLVAQAEPIKPERGQQ